VILAAIILLTIPFLLPQMHERYYYQSSAMILPLIFILKPFARATKAVVALSLIELAWLTGSMVYLSGGPHDASVLKIMMILPLLAIGLLWNLLLKPQKTHPVKQ
jgi:uncharacterized membrane protein